MHNQLANKIKAFFVAILPFKKRKEKSAGNPNETDNDALSVNNRHYESLVVEKTVPADFIIIPGEMLILNGPDLGKTFALPAYPSTDHYIASIGRMIRGGGYYAWFSERRKKSHIRVKDPLNRLARVQAEFIWQKNKLFIKNTGVPNIGIGNKSLKTQEMAIIEDGTTIFIKPLLIRYHLHAPVAG